MSFILLFLLFLGCSSTPKEPALFIETQEGEQVPLQVEVARTPEERVQGLSLRSHLPSGHGMLFIFGELSRIPFTMENTLIPLDILFLDKTGKILFIQEMAPPRSKEWVGSPYPYHFVLEVPGGTAARHGVQVGDQIRTKLLD